MSELPFIAVPDPEEEAEDLAHALAAARHLPLWIHGTTEPLFIDTNREPKEGVWLLSR